MYKRKLVFSCDIQERQDLTHCADCKLLYLQSDKKYLDEILILDF